MQFSKYLRDNTNNDDDDENKAKEVIFDVMEIWKTRNSPTKANERYENC